MQLLCEKCSVPDIVKKMKTLINTTQYLYPSTNVMVSAIIPGFKESPDNQKVCQINKAFQSLSKAKSCQFLKTFRPFHNADGTLKKELYTNDGLHLNHNGTVVLKQIFDDHCKNFKNL